jgi:hypothetical protein
MAFVFIKLRLEPFEMKLLQYGKSGVTAGISVKRKRF